MTFAELVFLGVGGFVIFHALQPVERWLASRLTRAPRRRRPRAQHEIIDIESYVSRQSDEDTHE